MTSTRSSTRPRRRNARSRPAAAWTAACRSARTAARSATRSPTSHDAVYRERWRDAHRALAATNDFPEFTGRICPAPCEGACVLNIDNAPVTIESARARDRRTRLRRGLGRAAPPARRTGKRVAVVGSGPAGLAAARAAQPRRPHRDRLRIGRTSGRPAPLRHPRLQAREVRHRSPPRSPRGRRHRVPVRRCRRPRPDLDAAARRATTRSSSRSAPSARATSTCPAATSRACSSRWTT